MPGILLQVLSGTKLDAVHKDADEKLAKERKEQGLDSVDTSIPVGGGLSDAEFSKKFGSGELPSTKENIERANKIQKSYG